MKVRVSAIAALLSLLLGVAPAAAQVQTGEITGRVTDDTGAVLPGVTVTLSSPVLIQPQTAVSSETGSFRFPLIPIGTYSLKFELPGFKTVVREGITVTIGFTADVNQQLAISTVQETVTVSGESPIVDTRTTAERTTFDLETLQNLPSARDPWVMLERTPGITMDRANVGGTQSGQQSGYVSRGSGTGNNKWSIDGVDITDMSATGASPIYYDFDMLQEMQVTTGGADASQQTGGVGINFVTRSGTNRFRGSGRYYLTDESLQSDNVTDEVKLQRSGSGQPIQNIKDYGFEVGGPIVRSKLWFWGSYGKQDIKAGIVGFYLPTPPCQAMKAALAADPLAPFSTKDQRACLGTDGTQLNNYNWKITYSPFKGNTFNFQNTWAEKFKNARDASDTRPIETTFRQRAVASQFGTFGWNVGPSPFWKAADQHVITDRWLVDLQWSHLGNNFILDFHEDGLDLVQPIFTVSTSAWSRSYRRSGPFIRPTMSVDLNTSYFLPAFLGGDHAFKAGYRYRTAKEHSEAHRGGNTEIRLVADSACRASDTRRPCHDADLWRDSIVDYELDTQAVYLQDTYSWGRTTMNLGFRWDRQQNRALGTSVPGHPFLADWLPAVTFAGADSPFVWNDISPRLGLNFDFTGVGKTIAKASYAIYYGQMSPNQGVSALNPVGEASIRFPWTDANGDMVVQREELTLGRSNVVTFSGNYNPDNPTFLGTNGSVDPNVRNDRTQEFIVGLDHELTNNFAISGNYIWRKYDRFNWSDRIGLTSSDYVARTYTASSSACSKPGTRCETVTYFEPTIPIPAQFIYTNVPDRFRNYNGAELVLTKRYSNRWMGSFSLAYNDAVDTWDSPAAYEDPTNIAQMSGAQFAPESGGSGIDNVFTNAKWLLKASGMYTLPLWDINLAGNLSSRQGYPFPQAIRISSRANRATTVDVLLDPLGDVRLSNFTMMDFRIDKAFNFGALRIIPSMDIFNMLNSNTVLARRRLQEASNANDISGIVAPRVIRFGMRVNW